MPPKSKMIARSPSPPEEDDGEEEWPVYGVVGEDVDVFGISRYMLGTYFTKLLTPNDYSYEIRWKNWSRPDGTNTTWMRDIEGDSTLVESWNDSLKDQRLRKAAASQSIDITRLASTPMHDRLTFERSEAVQEKMEERLRIAEPGQLYQGWMTEIEDQIARQESGRLGGEGSGPARSKKVNRIPPVGRYVQSLWLPSALLSQTGQILGKSLMPRAHAQSHDGNSVHTLCNTVDENHHHSSEVMTMIWGQSPYLDDTENESGHALLDTRGVDLERQEYTL
jgi:hypothetical protein